MAAASREFPWQSFSADHTWLSFQCRGSGTGESMIVWFQGTVGVRASTDGNWCLYGSGAPQPSGRGPRVSTTAFDQVFLNIRRVGGRTEAALYINPATGSLPVQTITLPASAEGVSTVALVYAGATGRFATGYLDNLQVGRGRPELGGGIPAPAAIAPMALVGLLAARRRRHAD